MRDTETIPDYPGHAFTGDPVPLPGAPVARVRLPSGNPVWLVTGYQEVRTALTHPLLSRVVGEGDPEVGTSGAIGGYRKAFRTLQHDGAVHTQVRRPAARPFTARRIAALRERVQQLTDGLLDELEAAGPPADLVQGLAYPLPITVISELFGVPAEDRDRFTVWSDRIVTVLGTTVEEVDAARSAIQGYLGELVTARRAEPGDDVISGWLASRHDTDDALTDTEIVRLAQTVLIGGYETTVNSIGAGMWRLFQHPEQLDALRADPGLLPGAVEEILRYQPQGTFFLIMVARGELELGGVTIREGEGVMPLPAAANRDAGRFGEPDRFDIRRPPGGHVAFGHGAHACLGAALARIEMEVAIGSLLRRFPGLRPTEDLAALAWREDRLVNGLRELPVTW
ncbi:cytochrome P450 [Streptomyces sp. NPDC001985]|uniref:cytochrome P450 n=1 Tax=Streptomyces sp. NPDC001985 TaxID=3154406 RepID=UPI0033209F7C